MTNPTQQKLRRTSSIEQGLEQSKDNRTWVSPLVVWVVLVFALFFLAQIVRVFMQSGSTFMGWPNVLFTTHFYNDRFAFSIPLPSILMYSVYILVLCGVFGYLYKKFYLISVLERFGWMIIVAGAFSNLFERITWGAVLDYVGIFTGVFNLADAYILLGILILLLHNSKYSLKD